MPGQLGTQPARRTLLTWKEIQIDAICSITNTKDRDFKDDMEKFCLQPLEQKRKTRRFSLRLKTLAKEEQHPAFTSTYEDLLNQPTANTVQTRF